MKKDILVTQYRTAVADTTDINLHKENTKPPQSYDKSEMSQDTGNTNPKNVRRNG